MSENFNTYIEGIEPDFWRQLCMESGELRHYPKGSEFVKAGSCARFIGYIRKGNLKYIATSPQGTEHVVGLEFAGEFVADFPFSIYGQNSRVSIIAVTDCDIYCLPVTEVAALMQADTKIKDIVMLSTEAIFSTVYDRYMDMYTLSPQERYNGLISKHPDIFTLFSLKDIASFLNITPTHLSRLRRNI